MSSQGRGVKQVTPTVGKMGKPTQLVGVITINFEEKAVYNTWAVLDEGKSINDIDWTEGEDLVFYLGIDNEWIRETFKDICIENVEVEENLIRLYVTSKL